MSTYYYETKYLHFNLNSLCIQHRTLLLVTWKQSHSIMSCSAVFVCYRVCIFITCFQYCCSLFNLHRSIKAYHYSFRTRVTVHLSGARIMGQQNFPVFVLVCLDHECYRVEKQQAEHGETIISKIRNFQSQQK